MKISAFFTAILAIFLVGCGTHQSFVALDAYTPSGNAKAASRSVIITAVADQRAKRDVIATIADGSGNVSEYVVLNTDIATYFKNALVAELAARGVSANDASGESSATVSVAITEFAARLSGYEKDNMKATIKTTLVINYGENVITKNFADTQTKFQLIPTGSAFAPLLKSTLDDMVKRVAEGIVKG